MCRKFKHHQLKGDALENALVRSPDRYAGRKINKLRLQIDSRFYPQFLIDLAESLADPEGECIKARVRQLSPKGEPYEIPGCTYRYDDETKQWQKVRFEIFDPTSFQGPCLELPPFPVLEPKTSTAPRIPTPDEEILAAQAAEVSRLIEEEEAEPIYWDNMTPEVHVAQAAEYFRLMAEMQAEAASEVAFHSMTHEARAAQEAECSRLMAEMEAADRSKNDEFFSDIPIDEHAAQDNVSLRLRHEDQATRS